MEHPVAAIVLYDTAGYHLPGFLSAGAFLTGSAFFGFFDSFFLLSLFPPILFPSFLYSRSQ